MTAPEIDRELVINTAHRAWKNVVLNKGSGEQATVAAITVALDMVEDIYAEYVNSYSAVQALVVKLQEENARLREAVDWYGSLVSVASTATQSGEAAYDELMKDAGAVSRTALQGGSNG
jgi:hypothetical protein